MTYSKTVAIPATLTFICANLFGTSYAQEVHDDAKHQPCTSSVQLTYIAEKDRNAKFLPTEEITAKIHCNNFSIIAGLDADTRGHNIESLQSQRLMLSLKRGDTQVDFGRLGEIHMYALGSSALGPGIGSNRAVFGTRIDTNDSVGFNVTRSDIALPFQWTAKVNGMAFIDASPDLTRPARGNSASVSYRGRLVANREFGPTQLTTAISAGLNQARGQNAEKFYELSMRSQTSLSDEWSLKADVNYLFFKNPIGESDARRTLSTLYGGLIYKPQKFDRLSLAGQFTHVHDSTDDDAAFIELASSFDIMRRDHVRLRTIARTGLEFQEWQNPQIGWQTGLQLTVSR